MSYENLMSEVEKKVGDIAAKSQAAFAQIKKIGEQIEAEKKNAEALEKKIEELQSHAGDSLCGGKYAKFKEKLSALMTERDNARELVQALEEALPRTRQQFTEHQRKLSDALTAFARAKSPVCEARMTELIGQVVAERDAFMDAMEKIHGHYGMTVKRGSGGIEPRCIHARIDQRHNGFVIRGRDLSVSISAVAAQQKQGPKK